MEFPGSGFPKLGGIADFSLIPSRAGGRVRRLQQVLSKLLREHPRVVVGPVLKIKLLRWSWSGMGDPE